MAIDFSASMNMDVEPVITEIDAAKNSLMQFRSSVNGMQREATELQIIDAATEAKAGEMIAQTKALKKQIETHQELLISSPQKFVRAVQSFTLPFRKDLESIEAQLKRKMGDYGYHKEMARRKAEAEAAKAAAALQKKIDKQAAKAGIEPVQIPAPIVPPESAPIRTESGTTSYVPVWGYELIRIEDVPHKYLMIDDAAIKAAIRAGIREIPGLSIKERMQVRTRTA